MSWRWQRAANSNSRRPKRLQFIHSKHTISQNCLGILILAKGPPNPMRFLPPKTHSKDPRPLAGGLCVLLLERVCRFSSSPFASDFPDTGGDGRLLIIVGLVCQGHGKSVVIHRHQLELEAAGAVEPVAFIFVSISSSALLAALHSAITAAPNVPPKSSPVINPSIISPP